MGKLFSNIQDILNRNRFLTQNESLSSFKGKIWLQLIIAVSFLILSITNVFTRSYIMLSFTFSGFAANAVFALVAFRTKNVKLCTYPSIILCAAIFAVFVVNGGNDGFASLWIALLPIFSMAIMIS